MGFFKDLDENVNAICCLSYCTLKVFSLEFVKRKNQSIPQFLIFLVLLASKISRNNCLPSCSH